jgi:hypothetical protein
MHGEEDSMAEWFVIGAMCAVIVGCGPVNPIVDDGAVTRDGRIASLDGPMAVPDGATASLDGTAPPSVTCNPGEMICNGNHLWSCTLSGHDATHVEDCIAEGTASNPSTCITSGCPGGNAACCKRSDDPCVYSVTSPVAMVGTCTPPQATLNTTCGTLSFVVFTTPAPAPNVCSLDIFEVFAAIDRMKHAVGTSFSLGAGDAVIYSATTIGVPANCSVWTGTVHWISDIPSWRVDLDLTCTTSSAIHLVGMFHGTL